MIIDGYFNQNDEPVVSLNLVSSTIEVLIDTGFAGSLIVPAALADDLILDFQGVDEFLTATGQEFLAPAYTVGVNWFGQQLRVPIAVSAEVRESLLGSQMLQGCRLTIDYGKQTVRIEQSG